MATRKRTKGQTTQWLQEKELKDKQHNDHKKTELKDKQHNGHKKKELKDKQHNDQKKKN
jgi:hypothetical protein